MKLPWSWLAEHVDLDGVEVDELVARMGLRGLEVEEVTRPGLGIEGVRTARVLHREPHPNADRLQLVHVTGEGGDGELGAGDVQVVCGADNFEVGDVVAHAVPGSRLPNGMTLDARKLRGVVSNGMLCSASELDLGAAEPASAADGIAILATDTPLGADVREVLPLGEPVIEVAVMADRGDHHCVRGVARDLAAILDTSLLPMDLPALPNADGVPVTIEDTDGCSHFVAVTITDVVDGTSPWWLRLRLAQCGTRAISTVVDVTNYVMLELGQPLHAFDLDTLHGPAIHARRARPGERLTTLDGVERVLEPTDLVVGDAERGAALAGVMGGLDTEVTDTTTRVLLEAAVWDPDTIRDTAARLRLPSEASLRFARRVDPAGAALAEQRAVQLLGALAGARVTGVGADGSADVDMPTITYDAVRYGAFLGLPDLDAEQQAALLRRAGAEVHRSGQGGSDQNGDRTPALEVTPPSWRGDLARPVDVAEEVMRLHGTEHVPAVLPALPTTGGASAKRRAMDDVRRAAEAAGFHEAITRPFVGDEAHTLLAPDEGRVVLANPLAQDAAALRPGLLDGLLAAVRRNTGHGRPGVALYELGRVFRPAEGPLDDLLLAAGVDPAWTDRDGGQRLPTQPFTLGLAATGRRDGRGWVDDADDWDLDDLLVVVDEVLDRLAPPTGRMVERRATTREGLHPTRAAEVVVDGVPVGVVGELHPTLAGELDLPGRVAVAELLVDPLVAHLVGGVPPRRARPLSTQPAMVVDVAVVADEAVPAATLRATVAEAAGELLTDAVVFDEYRGEQVGAGRRSIGLRLRLQAQDRALDAEDEQRVLTAVEEAVSAMGASLRS